MLTFRFRYPGDRLLIVQAPLNYNATVSDLREWAEQIRPGGECVSQICLLDTANAWWPVYCRPLRF